MYEHAIAIREQDGAKIAAEIKAIADKIDVMRVDLQSIATEATTDMGARAVSDAVGSIASAISKLDAAASSEKLG